MHPACPNKKQNHLQNSLLRRTQFWVRNTFSKPASLKRASLVGQEGHYIFDCCTEILRCILEDSAESSVFHRVIMSNEMSDLDGIVMQNKLRISYGFIGEQGHPRAIGKYDVPSVWAFQSCSLHGTGTLRHPNSSGAVAISKTARTAAMRLLPTLI